MAAKFGYVLVLVVLSVSVARADDFSNLRSSLKALDATHPDITASVTEVLSVTDAAPADPPGTTSWGRRNGTRTYRVSIHAGNSLVDCPSMGGDTAAPGAPRIAEKHLNRDGKMLTDYPGMMQGEIDDKPTNYVNPLLAATRINGLSLSELLDGISDVKETLLDGSTKAIEGKTASGPVRIVFTVGPQPRIQEFVVLSREGRPTADTTITEWQDINGFPVAKRMRMVVWPSGTGPATHEYSLSDLEPKASASDFEPSWKDGTRVSNGIDKRVYIFANGKLTPDPLFDQLAQKQSGTRAWWFIGSVSIALIAGLAALRSRKAKSGG